MQRLIKENAHEIMHVLLSAGYQAYIVGGAVRDAILQKPAGDIDITTDATPEQIISLAEKKNWYCSLVGEAFGVVIIKIQGLYYEVATFRCEGYGKDSHKPEWIDFAKNIEEDLARRDFTINALAMDISGNIIDPFDGQGDIKKGIIKTVGEPERRFAEDGLRVWRAVRFAAQLNFLIEKRTFEAMKASCVRCEGLSMERITHELGKILSSSNPAIGLELAKDCGILGMSIKLKKQENCIPILPELVALYGLAQNPRYHLLDVWGHTLTTVQNTRKYLLLRWAALLHDIAKGHPAVRALNKRGEISDIDHDKIGAQMAGNILQRLRQPVKLIKSVTWLIENHMSMPAPNKKSVLKWLKRLAVNCRLDNFAQRIELLLELKKADRQSGRISSNIEEILTIGQIAKKCLLTLPFFAKQLDITGEDILSNALCEQKEISIIQKELLLIIQNGQLNNEKNAIINYLQRKNKIVNYPHL